MKELIEAAFSAVNIFPTILFLLIIVYWLFVVIGALDMDFFNIDVDAEVDVDADVDVDVDADADVDTDTEVGATTNADAVLSLNSVLAFFNLGKVPFMILMSFFVLSMWFISISVNYLFHNQSVLIAILFLIPNIVVSLFVAKILTTPFAIVYTRMAKNSDDNFKYQGKICTLLMTATDSKIGQAEITWNGNTYRVNVKTKEGTQIAKGETGLIINYVEEKKCYLVEPYKL